MENLLGAWREFLRGKRKRKDVELFSLHLTDNLISLHLNLANKTYKHSSYTAFKINDPKPRDIHKASVRDRLLHHAIYRILYPYFDQFVKRELRVKHYIRYADDFVILSEDKKYLESNIRYIECYLREKLKLELHPDKVFIKTIASGVDFLGWVHFPTHRVLRTSTKRRMLKNTKNNPKSESLQSYLGMLKHGNTYKILQQIK